MHLPSIVCDFIFGKDLITSLLSSLQEVE